MATGTIPPPPENIDDAPTIQVCINQSWAHILIGQIWALRYPEAWGGTLEENRHARAEIKNLINMLMSEEGCGDMAECCEPTIYLQRLNPETGRIERSKDDGTTWTPDPADPIYKIVQQPPLVVDGGDHTKCDAATNFSEHFNDIITGCSENLGTASSIVQLAGGIAALLLDIFIIIVTEGVGIVVITTISNAIFAGISAAFAEGKAAFDAYWTSDRKDAVLCAAYCTIGDNGQFSQTEWEACKHRIKLDLTPSPALDMVLTSANAAGYVGASNMASYGNAADADCASCDCDCDDICADFWHIYFGTMLTQTGCTISGSSADDSGKATISYTWDGTHPCIFVDWHLLTGSIADVHFQWYLADGSGPFSSIVKPTDLNLQTLVIYSTDSTPFSASIDLATPP